MMHSSMQQDDANSAQKRRFVWTADLHSRFEAAVNALGLDNAKPKSILKLMNVDGLTKANIKSHLQKYRCLMQKKAQQARATGQPPPNPLGGMALGGIGSPDGVGGCGVGAGMNLGGGGGSGSLPELASGSLVPIGLDGLGGMGGSTNSHPSSIASTVQVDGMDGNGGLGALGSVPGGPAAGLPEQLISQGESSLQRNLEVQEMTLKVQMELQEELSRQLQLQKKLQSEMETLMASHAEAREEGGSASHKMSSILALKRKLQLELQAHLRMQHQLLTQLNQVVLPAVERLHTEGDAADLSTGISAHGSADSNVDIVKVEGSVKLEKAASLTASGDGEEEEGEDDDDDDDDESEEGASPAKRARSASTNIDISS